MGIKVIEGNFIRIGDNYEELTKDLQNFNGYLRISVKKEDGFEEGYIILEENRPIGYYYTYNNEEAFGEEADRLIEKMKKNDYIVEIYEYDTNKLNLMKDLFKEIFLNKSKLKTCEKEEIHTKTPLLSKYHKIVLNIPYGKPIKMWANEDYKKYLKNYKLLDIFKKENGTFKRGYVIYNNKEPILAAYEDNNGVLFGNDACDFIKELLNDSNIAIDIYEYDIEKIKMLKEYYPNMNLKEDISKKEDDTTENLDEFMNELSMKKEKPVNNNEKVWERLSREELLKKFGIKAPEDDMIDRLVQSIMEPDECELKNMEEDLKEKISKFLNKQDDIQDFPIDVSIKYNEGYNCECKVELKPKRKFWENH